MSRAQRIPMTVAFDRSAAATWATLEAITRHPRHVFWENSFGYQEIPFSNLRGAKQVTDAWLAELARRRQGKLMTFDSGLTLLHNDVVEEVP